MEAGWGAKGEGGNESPATLHPVGKIHFVANVYAGLCVVSPVLFLQRQAELYTVEKHFLREKHSKPDAQEHLPHTK